MEDVLVSIITVVFNGEKHLQQTIDSVFDQSYKNIEYIIIDGGSTDNTLKIIDKNKHKITSWISEPDKGLYDAMNKGIIKANGELIGIINSDDWFEPDTIKLVVETYLTHPDKNIIHGARYDVFSDGFKKEFQFNTSNFKFKYYNMTYSHPSMFVTKCEYKRHNYNTSLKAYSDYQFTLESFLNNKNGLVYISQPLVNFRLGGISSQLSFIEELKEAFIARRSAGMNTMEALFAAFLKLSSLPILLLKKYIKSRAKV